MNIELLLRIIQLKGAVRRLEQKTQQLKEEVTRK